ncbi:hypothetical protein [Streptomyces lydicus]|uniref:hypothetical protein n=1 Tax=Streptomyces lydicus TaxID=47763 RepID=UPI00378928AE
MRLPDNIPFRHGYTLGDLDRITRIVIRTDRWRTDMHLDDRYDAIRFAVIEHLLTTDEPPTRHDLVYIGQRASDTYVSQEMHHRGYDPRQPGRGPAGLPGFQRYWQGSGRAPWDERVVERIALTQVWPCLTTVQQQAVTALAVADDHQAAASMLGVPYPTYAARLRKGRQRVLEVWHEHETPRPQKRDKRVLARSGTRQGRRLLTEADLETLRDRQEDGATLRQLASETGYSAGALCNLLRGKRRPAATRGAA